MNFFVFTVVILIAIQGAYAIKCHKCQPNEAEIVSAASEGNASGLNLCSNPTDTFDCSQDPYIGSYADACHSASVTMNISLLNIGEVKNHVLDCAMQSGCSQMKTSVCDSLKSVFLGFSGFGISYCDISCCQGDLCNKPSGPPATAPPTSSVKSTQVPPNAALFGILGLVNMAFMGLF